MARNYNIDELLSSKSFRAWAQGRANAEQKRCWDRWIQQSSEHRRKARQAQIQLTGFSFKSIIVPHTSAAWNRLQSKITEHSQSEDRSTSASYKRGYELWKYYGIIASLLLILVVCVMVFFAYQHQSGKVSNKLVKKTITTEYGQRKKIMLSDRKSIVLGAHSTLSYVEGVKPDQPERIMLRGEAYFKAKPDSSSADTAFTIHTRDGKIADIGTKFVVSARGKGTSVILKSGSVAITPVGGVGKQLVLGPGQMAMVSKGSPHIEVKEVNPDIYTSWATNRLTFDHTQLLFVKKRLEQNFGIQVKICGKELTHRSLSGSIKNAGLHVIMSSLADALDTDYTIKKDRVYLGNRCH